MENYSEFKEKQSSLRFCYQINSSCYHSRPRTSSVQWNDVKLKKKNGNKKI